MNATVFDVRQKYRLENGFGADGGNDKSLVIAWLGWVPVPVPNPPARKRAIEYHDCHHTMTGYGSDWQGEFEQSAWEVATGCGWFWVGWAINLGGMALGLVTTPKRTIAAFVRGRHTRNLYDRRLEDVLARPWEEVRRESGLDQPAPAMTSEDLVALIGWGAVAWAWTLAQAGLVVGILAGIAWSVAWLVAG